MVFRLAACIAAAAFAALAQMPHAGQSTGQPAESRDPRIDKQVGRLIERMLNRQTGEKAFSDLDARGCSAVPAIIARMDDRRRLTGLSDKKDSARPTVPPMADKPGCARRIPAPRRRRAAWQKGGASQEDRRARTRNRTRGFGRSEHPAGARLLHARLYQKLSRRRQFAHPVEPVGALANRLHLPRAQRTRLWDDGRPVRRESIPTNLRETLALLHRKVV